MSPNGHQTTHWHNQNEDKLDWCIKFVTELGASKNLNDFNKANKPISFLHKNQTVHRLD